jgi:hypothetical protein
MSAPSLCVAASDGKSSRTSGPSEPIARDASHGLQQHGAERDNGGAKQEDASSGDISVGFQPRDDGVHRPCGQIIRCGLLPRPGLLRLQRGR